MPYDADAFITHVYTTLKAAAALTVRCPAI